MALSAAADRVQRMKDELQALEGNLRRLEAFILLDPAFQCLVMDEQMDLIAQCGAMRAYRNALHRRVERAA